MEKREQDVMRELKKLKKDDLVKILTDYVIDSYEYMEECGENDDYEEYKSTLPPTKEFKLLTPMEIKTELDKTVIGQDDTKIKLATEVFRHYLRIMNEDKLHKDGKKIGKNNILLTGLTGTGKTFLLQTIAKILNVPIYIQDSTGLSATGYRGGDVEDCLKGLFESADFNIKSAERGIIVLDEFDKLSSKNSMNDTRDVSGADVQAGLLKLTEGNIVTIPQQREKIDTSNILFVAIGAFSGIEDIVKERLNKKNKKQSIGFGATIQSKSEEVSLKELRMSVTRDDLKKYGIVEEMLGRFTILANLHPLEKEDLINILKNRNGLFDEYETVFELMDKKLIIKEDVYEFIAEKSLSEMTGARGLKAIAEDLMYKTMYKMPSNKKKQYVIDKKFLEEVNMA